MRFLLVIYCFTLIGCQSFLHKTAKDANLDKPMSSGERGITEIINIGRYTIEIKNWPRLIDSESVAGILTVKRNSFSRSMEKLNFCFKFEKKIDVTGDSKEDFVFSTWSGGAHGFSDLVIFDSKIEKFHVFFFSDWLGTNNEYLKDYFDKNTSFAFTDINGDTIPELLILYPWPYYIMDFAGSPQDLKIYSLKGSKIRDITSKCGEFMKKAIDAEMLRYDGWMQKEDYPYYSRSININILLMSLSGGFDTEKSWKLYEENYKAMDAKGIHDAFKNGFNRRRIEKDKIKYDNRYKPYTK
jgi:hypothetical protein